MFGLPVWAVAIGVVAVLVAVLSGRGGGKKRRGGGGGRGGRIAGLPVLLVVGLLLGATALGGQVVRRIVAAIVHAVTTFGGLFGA